MAIGDQGSPRTALGGNIAVDIVQAAGINPQQIQLAQKKLNALLDSATATVDEARQILKPLADLVNSLQPSAPSTQRTLAMSTDSSDPIDTPATLGPMLQTLTRAKAISAVRQYHGIRAAIATRIAFQDPDFSAGFFASVADHMSKNGMPQLPNGQIDESDANVTALGQPGHPLLTNLLKWLQNGGLQWIINVITMLLPLFGGPTIPPITLPPIPTVPTSAHIAEAHASHGDAEFAVPPAIAIFWPLLQDLGTAEVQFLLDWARKKLVAS